MRWQLSVLALVATATFGLSQTGAGKSDQDSLQGNWQVVGLEKDGSSLPNEVVKDLDGKLTFKGNGFTWKTSQDEEDSGTFTLNASKKPKQMDIKAKNLNNGKTIKCIYELKGDDLKVCFDHGEDGDRPSEFKTKEGSELMMLVFKRAKK